MKKDTGKRALEAYKIFPYVAWGLILGFTLFVYNIVTELEQATDQLQRQTKALEAQISADVRNPDFDSYNQNRYQPKSAQE